MFKAVSILKAAQGYLQLNGLLKANTFPPKRLKKKQSSMFCQEHLPIMTFLIYYVWYFSSSDSNEFS